ncbi:MAG: hypothetical protein PSN34_12935 [Urechidicola sp.]|nr:hypothetical protein [Urechidicola sp.]
MKKTIVILFIFFTSIVKGQTGNIITETEYNNIEINGVKLGDIKDTHGVESEMENLFGVPVNKEINEAGYYSRYFYNDLRFNFSSILSGKQEHILGSFHIEGTQSSIKINGNIVTIGDNISLLGSTIKNVKPNGDKSIIYQYCNGCNNYIAINYNQSRGVITSISYIERT